ncbi:MULTISPECIES: outer membrane beta-barrel protein [Culturomica]|jgi:hypothetical protein|uniref:outer membrane beta-barrel protein n=1 Tax=Culturomica TaxID=1926651 RepID=UPI00033A20D6|nr:MULTISPECIES: outer membrane beta-barrel protein [Odoribacteraceae]RHV91222.1 hypothetical protein DXA95_13990 [Odoribacter sp. OF09-27XD]CCZ08027.1 putative uncharacterized protein [Odoribacter sp. CAG:788]HBO27087.1 hypothetical protein [Culturomica sp.]
MKYTWILCLIFLLGVSVGAVAKDSEEKQEKKEKKEKPEVWYGKWPVLGLRIGTDIGGALPFPFSNIPSEFAPKIKPRLTFGGEVIVPVSKRFTITAEVNYKTVAIDAEAFVEEQFFQAEGLNNNEPVFFTGMADMNMSFSMIEIPVYAEYQFSGGRNRVMLGGYYTINKKQSFDVVAKKGYMQITKGDEDVLALNTNFTMSFTDDLDSWDAGVLFGYERRIMENLSVNGKVHIGLKSIFTDGFDKLEYKMYQMRLAVGVTYELIDFNKKYHLKKYIPSFRRKKKTQEGK